MISNTQKKDSNVSGLYVGVMFLLLISSVLIIGYLSKSKELSQTDNSNKNEIKNSDSCIEKPYVNQSKFKIVGDYTYSDQSGLVNPKIILGNYPDFTTKRMEKTVLNLNVNKFAFISTDEEKRHSNGDSYTRSVYIYDIGSKEEKKIYQFKSFQYDNQEYVHELEDLGFSEDGDFLAITTSESLILHDLKTGNQTKVFQNTRRLSNKSIGGIWGYERPRFSPDNSRIIVSSQYYEGNGTYLINVKSKTFKKLPYDFYDDVIDWYGDKMIVTKKTHNPINPGEVEKTLTRIYLVSPDSLKEELIGNLNGDFYGKKIIDKDYKNFLIGTTSYVANEGFINCYSGRPDPFFTYYFDLVLFNLETGENKVLMSVDHNNSKGKKDGTAISNSDIFEGKVFVRISHENYGWYSDNFIYIDRPQELYNIKY